MSAPLLAVPHRPHGDFVLVRSLSRCRPFCQLWNTRPLSHYHPYPDTIHPSVRRKKEARGLKAPATRIMISLLTQPISSISNCFRCQCIQQMIVYNLVTIPCNCRSHCGTCQYQKSLNRMASFFSYPSCPYCCNHELLSLPTVSSGSSLTF